MSVVELFELTVVPHGTFRYTSGNQAIVHGGEAYAKIPVSRRDSETASGPENSTALRFQLPIDNTFSKLFEQYPPQRDATCTILRGRFDFDTDALTDVEALIVDGLVTSTGSEDGQAFFEVHPLHYLLDAVGPRKIFSGACQWRIYGPGCKASKAAFEFEVDFVSADKDARTITVRTFDFRPADFLVGGLYQAGGQDPLLIIKQPAPTEPEVNLFEYVLTVSRWGAELEETPIKVAPGCTYSRDICESRFDNLDNFGGFDRLTNVDRSPFLDGWSQ